MAKTAESEKYTFIVNGVYSPVKAILTLSWPVVAEQFLSTFVNYADTAMVGGLGAYATAAVSISGPVFMLIGGVSMSLGVGITALLARAVGAGDTERAKSLIRHSILLILCVGFPISIITAIFSRLIPLWMHAGPDVIDYAAQYNIITSLGRPFAIALMVTGSVFRGCGDTRTPMKINLIMNIINVVGNYLLINPTHQVMLLGFSWTIPGLGWQVAGAAAATSLSQIAAGLTAIILLYRKPWPFRIGLKESYRIDPALLKPVVRISAPAMLERFALSLAAVVLNAAIASMGTVVLAANILYQTAESISFMPGFAFMTAITTIVGQCLGAKDHKLAERYIGITCGVSALLLSFLGAMIYIFARQILSFFTPDEQVISIAASCLHIVAFMQPFQVVTWVLNGSLAGAGDTKVSFLITIACNWTFRTVAAYIAIRFLGLGLPAVMVCYFADNIVRGILLFIRLRSGKWINAAKV
jgi:putative MATE family efflux protein